MNTISFLSIPASIVPEQEAVVFEEHRLTYAALHARVRRLAGALAQRGVGRGTRVAALHTNSHRYIEAYYATAMLGGVFIPVNYRAKRHEIEYMLATAETKVLFIGERYVEHVDAVRERLVHLTQMIGFDFARADAPSYESLLRDAPEHEDEAEVDDEDVSILMYTSGTMSLPKGVMLRYGDFSAYVTANVELADGTPRGAALLCAPLYHIAGATNMMTTLWTGRKLVVMPQFDAPRWLDLVEGERVTHAFVVPTMMKHVLDAGPETRDLSCLEVLSYGGAPMPFPVIRRAIERLPRTVGFVNAFGQTETTSTLTVLGPDDHRLDGTPAEVETRLRRLTSIGKPLPDVEVRIIGDEGQPLGTGDVGEIEVRTARAMKGYAGAVESPFKADGWLPTKDMGWIDEDGYLYVAGRKDDMIIRGGENIAPAEIESVLLSHPAVDEIAVFGVADVEWGQRVAACIVPRPGMSLTEDEIAAFCKTRLASFKKPEVVRFLTELPKNPMGKILRRELRAQIEGA